MEEMNDHPVRLFESDENIRRVGEGMIACTLPRPEWTHEGHLAACAWLILERPDLVAERDLPGLIRRYNESVGGVNDETQGYHETITQCFVRGARLYLAGLQASLPLVDKVNGLLKSRQGSRDWPSLFYSPERLFSVASRLSLAEPDLRPLPSVE
jgi:hypothetical protein